MSYGVSGAKQQKAWRGVMVQMPALQVPSQYLMGAMSAMMLAAGLLLDAVWVREDLSAMKRESSPPDLHIHNTM